MAGEGHRLVVTARRELATDIVEFTLAAADGAVLPGFEPGAHVTVETPGGAMRRYSLVGSGAAPAAYVIAVKREPRSRGGSVAMHDHAPVGTVLTVLPPENDFPLLDAARYVLIAGGIGITPILGMARALRDACRPFRLIYCTRDAAGTAYAAEARALGAIIHHDGGDPAAHYDFWDDFATPDPAARVYCCGPAPLMEEVRALTGHWERSHVHFEDFKPVEVVRADDRAFKVTLARSGQRIEVPAGRTILESLRAAGVRTVSSCESGTCGTCKTRLVSGTADHRDMVLMPEEKDTHIMICVSRAAGEAGLVLDL
ncbi:MAG: PDR/VanB family oxidoreductase [Gemmobacter sp.]